MVAVVTRAQWGAVTRIPGGRGVAPSARRFFVAHWPVMTSRDERQWCRDIERIHATQGWAVAPGYNFIVGQSGSVYEGCGRDVRGIHSPPRNVDGWGVCILQPSTPQGLPTAPVSAEARTAARALYEELCQVANRRLAQSWHGQDWATACPGPDLTRWVRDGMPADLLTPPTPEENAMATTAVDSSSHRFVFEINRNGHLFCKRRRHGTDRWENINVMQTAFNSSAAAATQFRQASFGALPVGDAAECFVELATGGVRRFIVTPDGQAGAQDLP